MSDPDPKADETAAQQPEDGADEGCAARPA